MVVRHAATESPSRKSARRAHLELRLGLLSVCLLGACERLDGPTGGLVVVVETDLALPKDIDQIRLEVKRPDHVILAVEHLVGEGQLLLPAEFRIAPAGDDQPVLIHGIALSQGKPRIERSAITPIPRSRLGMLRLPFNFLCDGTANEDGSSNCGLEQTCKQGACAPAIVAEDELPTYTAGPGAIGENGVPRGGNCFDVHACFESRAEPSSTSTAAASATAGRRPRALERGHRAATRQPRAV